MMRSRSLNCGIMLTPSTRNGWNRKTSTNSASSRASAKSLTHPSAVPVAAAEGAASAEAGSGVAAAVGPTPGVALISFHLHHGLGRGDLVGEVVHAQHDQVLARTQLLGAQLVGLPQVIRNAVHGEERRERGGVERPL